MTELRLHKKFISWKKRVDTVISLLENIKSEMRVIAFSDPINKNVCEITKAMLNEINAARASPVSGNLETI